MLQDELCSEIMNVLNEKKVVLVRGLYSESNNHCNNPISNTTYFSFALMALKE
jgi:hypothetical protein